MKSIFEVILDHVRKIPSVKEYYGDHSRHADFYDHVFTGLFIMMLANVLIPSLSIKLAVWCAGVGFHVLYKELWLDRFKNEGRPLGKKVDLITRSVGWVLGLPFIC